MSRSRRPTNVAFMEDCDEDTGSSLEGIEGTRKYAISEAPVPPRRQQPNTSKSRTNDQYRPSSGKRSDSNPSDPARPPRKEREEPMREKAARRSKEAEREQREEDRQRKEERREKEARRQKAEERAAKESSKALKKVRPSPLKHSQTQPVVQQTGYRRGHDDPRAYGIQQPAVSGSRPRANTRPASYYAGQVPRPPTSNMGYPSHGMHPPPFPVGTFPPPQMFPPGPPPVMHGLPPLPSPTGMQSYFDGGPSSHPRDLRSRFDRPSSAMGFSPSSRSYLQEEYGYEDDLPQRMSHARRPSHSQRNDDDRKRMPPPDFIPARPRTTANPSTPFQAPPPRPSSRHGHPQPRPRPSQRRSVGFNEGPGYDDEDFLVGGGEDLFHDISPEPNYARQMAARRQPIAYDHEEEEEEEEETEESEESDDEDGGYQIMPAKGRASRRGSMYSGALGSGGVSLDGDRYTDAMRYQDDITGGPQVPLTAETLRKANKRGEVASSRSTRSSASRDESEYRRSNTTGITRSSSGGDDTFTIKVSGGAVVRVQGAEIECDDGGEITFNGRPGTARVGSDRASTVFQLEDSRSRVERKALPHRPRAPSQSDSQSRGYAPSHAPYETAPYDPNYSSYY